MLELLLALLLLLAFSLGHMHGKLYERHRLSKKSQYIKLRRANGFSDYPKFNT